MADDDEVIAAALKDAKIQAKRGPSDEQLNAISMLADRQINLEIEISEVEAKLAELNAQLKKVSEGDLPQMMAELGLRSFTMDDDYTIEIAKVYQASIPVENRPEAYDWLVNNGHAGIIKTNVMVTFGKGQQFRDEANLLVSELQKEGLPAELDESVHPGTLKAWAKEQLINNVKLPNLFTVFQGDKAKVGVPKKKVKKYG